MHKFLRAVGFSKITKEELNDIFQKIIERPMLQKVAEDSEGNEFAELSIEFGDFFGLSLRGTFNENDSFEMSYYYPYFCGNKISTTEQIDIEKHAEKESYAGICPLFHPTRYERQSMSDPAAEEIGAPLGRAGAQRLRGQGRCREIKKHSDSITLTKANAYRCADILWNRACPLRHLR